MQPPIPWSYRWCLSISAISFSHELFSALSRPLVAGARDEPNRRSRQRVVPTQLVFQIALVGKVHQIRIVAKKHKGGWPSAHLRGVINLERLAFTRIGPLEHRILNAPIELTG